MLFQLKTISFLGKACSIVCQNENGPCPLLAIANILILQRRIIVDAYATSISLTDLVTVVANTMIAEVDARKSNDAERSTLSTVLQILPQLANGLDLNVFFSSVDKFEFTREMSVFDILGLKLFHGWLVDPKGDALTMKVLSNLSYTQSVLKLVDFKTLSDKIRTSSDLNRPVDLKDEDKELIRCGLTIERFFNQNATQLTTPGLHALYNVMIDRQLAVFFRNNHFSTLFSFNGQLFNLVTDAGYLHEHTVVWEILDGIDGSSEFYNASFEPLSSYKVSDFSPPPMSSTGSSYKSSYGGTVAAPPPSQQQHQPQQQQYSVYASPPQGYLYSYDTPAQPPSSAGGGGGAPSRQQTQQQTQQQLLNQRTHFLDTFNSPLHHSQPGSSAGGGGGGAAPSSAARGTTVSSPLKGNVVAPASIITSPVAPLPTASRPAPHAPSDDDDMRGITIPASSPTAGSSLTRSSFAMQSSPVASSQRQLMRTASMDAKQFKQSPTASSVASSTHSAAASGLSVSVPPSDPTVVHSTQSLDSLQYSPMSMEPSPGPPSNRIAAPSLQKLAIANSSNSSSGNGGVPGLDLTQPSAVAPVSLSATAKEHSSIVSSQRQLLRTASKRSMDHSDPAAVLSAHSGSPQVSPRGQPLLPPTHGNGNLLRSASSGSTTAISPTDRQVPLSRLEVQQMQMLRGNGGTGSNNGSGSGTPPVLLRDQEEVRSVSSGGSAGHHRGGAWTNEQSPNKGNEVYISRYGANSSGTAAAAGGGAGGGNGSGSGSAASSYNESPMTFTNAGFSPQGSPTKSGGGGANAGSGAAGAAGGSREHSNAIKTAINTIINSNSSALPSIINTIIDSSSGPGSSVSSRDSSSRPAGSGNAGYSTNSSTAVSGNNTSSSRSFTSGGIANKHSFDDEDLRMNDPVHRAAAQAGTGPQPLSHDEEEDDYQLALRLQREMNTLAEATNTTGAAASSANTAGTSPLPSNNLSSASSDKFDVLRYGSSSQARGGGAAGGGGAGSPVPLSRQGSAGGGLVAGGAGGGVTAAAAGVPIPSSSAAGGGAPLTRQGSAGSIQKSNSSSGYNLLSRHNSSGSVKSNSLPVATTLTPAAPPASPRAAAAPPAPPASTAAEFSQYLSPSELAAQRAAMEAYERDKRGAAGGGKKKGGFLGLFG